jgi:hypothetical protein
MGLLFAPSWFVPLLLAAASQPSASASKGEERPRCETWLRHTLKAVEAKPTLRQRDFVITAVACACAGVPERLRRAAEAYGKAKGEKSRAQILVNASAEILKDNCSVADPLASAEALVAPCPLPGPGEKAHPVVLGKMRAADYVFLNAFMTSLIASGAYDETAYRIVLEFIVSSAQLSERPKTKKRE